VTNSLFCNIDESSYLRSYTNCGPNIRSSHDYKFLNVNATKNVYFYSFFPRPIRMWNKLQQDIIESSALETFRTEISKYFTELSILVICLFYSFCLFVYYVRVAIDIFSLFLTKVL